MKAIELLLTPRDAGFNPVDTALAEAEQVCREALVSIDAFDPKTGVYLYRVRESTTGATRSVVDRVSQVAEYSLADSEGDLQHVYCRCSFARPSGFLTRVASQYPVIIEPPVQFTDRGTARVVLAGDSATLDEVLDDTADVTTEVVRTEPYTPERADPLDDLTDHQRAILERLVESGYYETPPRSTRDDLATDLDISKGTLDDHIRRIEKKVFHDLTGGPPHSNRPVSLGP